MKKTLSIAAFLSLFILILAGCGQGDSSDKVIKIGATPKPHAEILEQVKDQLKDDGYTLEIIEYTDYVQPNVALDSGDLDANFFQHQPYLDQYNAENEAQLISAAIIHYEPFGLYPGKTDTIDALADGSQIAVPNDATNEARALLLLQDQGLITLTEGVGLNATINNIVDNPKNIDILEIEAAQLTRSLQDVDMAVINGNYAIDAGLSVGTDALAVEDKDSTAAETFGNIIAVKEGTQDSEKIQALVKALQSDTVKNFIETTYEGAVIPKF